MRILRPDIVLAEGYNVSEKVNGCHIDEEQKSKGICI